MLTSSVRHNAMNYLLCLYGGAHAEPSRLCYGCVKKGMISWVGWVSLVVQLVIHQWQAGRGYEMASSVSICLTIECKVGMTKALARMIGIDHDAEVFLTRDC